VIFVVTTARVAGSVVDLTAVAHRYKSSRPVLIPLGSCRCVKFVTDTSTLQTTRGCAMRRVLTGSTLECHRGRTSSFSTTEISRSAVSCQTLF